MSDEREDPRGAVNEPTTMRLRAVEGTEPVEAVHESDHLLTKAEDADYVAGIIAAWAASRSVLRAPLLPALRGD